jgi:DNA polymerase III delta prime subunit
MLTQPHALPLIGLILGAVTLAASFTARPDVTFAPQYDSLNWRNRQRLLYKVRRAWIDGVLDASLYGANPISIEIIKRSDAVRPRESMPEIPDDTPIVNAFDRLAGRLLILGEPGSGKTTDLLRLARTLLERAAVDSKHPMPIVFNLASWVVEQREIFDWLVVEFKYAYRVPDQISKDWIRTGEVTLLLDGLDEVKLEHRANCVDAINHFLREYAWVNMAVASRSADYEAQSERLVLNGALELQPLTLEQIDTYLADRGDHLVTLRRRVRDDSTLRTLAATPLMLSMMTRAYRDADPPMFQTIDEYRQNLIHVCADRLLAPQPDDRYTSDQTRRWLSWLARAMTQHAQSVLYLADLSPAWLTDDAQRRTYNLFAFVLYAPIVALLVYLFITDISLKAELGQFYVGILLAVFATSIVDFLLSRWRRRNVALISSHRRWFALGHGLATFLALGLPMLLAAHSLNIPDSFVVFTLFVGAFLGFMYGWASLRSTERKPQPVLPRRSRIAVASFSWLWPKTQSELRLIQGMLITFGFLIGIAIGLSTTLAEGARFESIVQPTAQQIIAGLLFGVLGGLTGWSILSVRLLDVKTETNPSGSLRDQVIAPGIWILIILLMAYLTTLERVGVFPLLQYSYLLYAASLSIFQPLLVRLALRARNDAPFNYLAFLNHVVRRNLLRRVGGGYIFDHPLLQRYYAALELGGAASTR